MIRLSEANTAQSTLDKVKADHDGKLEVLDCVVEAKVLEGKLTVYVFSIRCHRYMSNKALSFVLSLVTRIKYMWFGGHVFHYYR